jgi:serine/threonine protein kinase
MPSRFFQTRLRLTPHRLARFRREAQVLASLNHPNIAHVYGLEQSDGVQALVMELVEGPTNWFEEVKRLVPTN